mmetsp:Transcript_33388/g.84122  ORF Transcript_33388/g.84122 Transcript_33388/m.84122 type:complete len:123 (-) Transcript_33388:94-462(-)
MTLRACGTESLPKHLPSEVGVHGALSGMFGGGMYSQGHTVGGTIHGLAGFRVPKPIARQVYACPAAQSPFLIPKEFLHHLHRVSCNSNNNSIKLCVDNAADEWGQTEGGRMWQNKLKTMNYY